MNFNQKSPSNKMIHGSECRIMMIGSLFLCQSLTLGNPTLWGMAGGAALGAAGQVISEILTDNVKVERVLNKYEILEKKMRKGTLTTINQKIWDSPNASGDIKTFKINYYSSYYQRSGSQTNNASSSQAFEPVMLVSSTEQLAPGMPKEVPLKVRYYECILSDYDYDLIKTSFGFRVQWKYQDGARIYWTDKKRFKVVLENWTPMPGSNCGDQYNDTGAWYVSPEIDRNGGSGEIICSAKKTVLGGVVNLEPNQSSQLLFKEHNEY